MGDPTVSLAAIALVGTVLALVVTPLFKLLNANTKALEHLVAETARGNHEAAERNGHLGEQNVKITELIVAQGKDAKDNLAANRKIVDILSKSALIAAEDRDFLTSGQPQIVSEQTVEHQVIKHKE